MQKKLVIATDHRGYALKEHLKTVSIINSMSIYWNDVGCFSPERCDYPVFAHAALQQMIEKKFDGAVLLCGTGIGMAIVANRYKHIRSAVVWNDEIARRAKEDDEVNVLALPADYISPEQAASLVKIWLTTHCKSGVYAQRVVMIDELYKK